MTVPQAFDSLIAKLIVTGATRTEALERARRALAEFEIDGMPTVLPFHRAVVDDPAFTGEPFAVHTRWIETEFAGRHPAVRRRPAGEPVKPSRGSGSPSRSAASGWRSRSRRACAGRAGPALGARRGPRPGGRGAVPGAAAPAGGQASGDDLVSPMQGTIVKIVAADGEQVSAGDTIVVLEAMKMEQPLTAHKAGTVTGLTVQVGQTVPAGAVICQLSAEADRRTQVMARLPGDPGVAGWLRFAAGFRLPAENLDWVRHELTDAGWRGRTVLRHLAVIIPICAIVAVLLLRCCPPRPGSP